ncbi:MAG: prepilin peptidase [Candidatus Methylacidiphilales bacterium]|nr:prepilin peptidase [Candidatus Methylacidiphilales bacterium]
MSGFLPFVFVIAVGLCIGSFLNVCIFRMPLGRSITLPASRCFACGIVLPWWRNLPVLSWLAQRGRCGCGLVKLSARYPIVELLTAGWFAAVWRVQGADPLQALLLTAFGCSLLVAAFIDLDHFIIPDEISLGGCVAGLLASALCPALQGARFWWGGLGLSFFGLLIGAGGLLLIAMIGTAVMKKDAMGMGDVKLLGAMGAFLGWEAVLFIVAVSSMLGASFGLAMILARRGRWGVPIPFGPYLVAAAMIWMLGGSTWMDAYWAVIKSP